MSRLHVESFIASSLHGLAKMIERHLEEVRQVSVPKIESITMHVDTHYLAIVTYWGEK